MRPDPQLLLPYLEAAHGVQTGVMYTLEKEPPTQSSSPASPKMLRTGIDMCMSDMGGLIELLVSKGIITDEEVKAAITRSANIERESYEKRLSEVYGAKINLR